MSFVKQLLTVEPLKTIYFPVKSIPRSIKNVRLFVLGHSLCRTTSWQIKIRGKRSYLFLNRWIEMKENAINFQRPKPHSGWNGTLFARNYQSICPQLDNNVYEEMSNGFNYQTRTSEDCLYLNIWTPEVAFFQFSFICNIKVHFIVFKWFRRAGVMETHQFCVLLLAKKWHSIGQGTVRMVST